MKISCVTSKIYSPHFQQNEPIAFDDEESKRTREYIRNYWEGYYMPYQSIYEKEPFSYSYWDTSWNPMFLEKMKLENIISH